MISPIAKFALAMAAVIDTVLSESADELPVSAHSTRIMLLEQREVLALAVTEFKATGGAE